MNFDGRNFSIGQESQCLPFQFQSHQDNESIHPIPIYNENFRSTQRNSQMRSETLNFKEWQPQYMQFQAENIGHTSPQMNEWRTSYQDHPQALRIQPRVPQPPFQKQFSQEGCVWKENFHLNPPVFEYENKEVNYYENTFQRDHRGEFLNADYTNINKSTLSNQFSSTEVHVPFNHLYEQENMIVPHFKEFQGNEMISEELHQTSIRITSKHFDPFKKSLPSLVDPEQFCHIQAACNNQSNQQSINYFNGNLFHEKLPGEYPYPENRRIRNSTFSNPYLANEEHQPLCHPCLQENEPNQSPFVYQDNGMNSKELSDPFNVQSCVTKSTDMGNSAYAQASWNKQGFQQSMTFNGENSFFSARKNTSTEINRQQVYENTLVIGKNMNLGIDHDNLRDKPHNYFEINDLECKTDHLNRETFTNLTAPDKQNKPKLDCFPSCATTSRKILPLASPASTHYKKSSDYSVSSWLESNTIHCSNKQYENWFQCNISTNEDKYENLTTSCTDDVDILQGYNPLTDSSKEESFFPRNHNVGMSYNGETSNREPFAYSLYKNSFSIGQNLNIRPHEHNNETPFRCNICGWSFKQKSHLDSHIRIHTNERPYKCLICHESYKQIQYLNVHICTHINERPYQCNICHKSFKYESAFKCHLRTHTNERPYKCNMCPLSFKQKSHLNTHINNHTKVKLYQCDICHKSFTRNETLNVHIQTHTKERPYQCSICHNRFNDKSTLTKHIRTHTDERPYQCSICSKSFKQTIDLKRHMRTHTKERPYQCHICSKRFTRRTNRNRHIRTH